MYALRVEASPRVDSAFIIVIYTSENDEEQLS